MKNRVCGTWVTVLEGLSPIQVLPRPWEKLSPTPYCARTRAHNVPSLFSTSMCASQARPFTSAPPRKEHASPPSVEKSTFEPDSFGGVSRKYSGFSGLGLFAQTAAGTQWLRAPFP